MSLDTITQNLTKDKDVIGMTTPPLNSGNIGTIVFTTSLHGYAVGIQVNADNMYLLEYTVMLWDYKSTQVIFT